jgi:cytidylate kinase
LIIAIDGPSGAGKGTVARAVAARLGYRHVDTGAMYRALAWKALHDGLDLADEAAVAAAAERATFDLEQGRVGIDGHDVASAIRTPEMDRAATQVARHPAVRRVLVARQRGYGAAGAVVMEGRDIGTVVFPDADVKIYLDASPEERARRRATDPGLDAPGIAARGRRRRRGDRHHRRADWRCHRAGVRARGGGVR